MVAPRFLTLLFALLSVGPLVAQPGGTRLRGEAEAARTRKRITEAQQKLTDGKPADAADDLQKVLDESGDDLVLVKDNNFQPARRLVQQSLAALPAETLATFRNRIDEPARRLLDAGKKNRDPKPLRELIDRYFVSRPAEEGLLLLGELAFERGEFDAAVRHWSALLPGDAATDLEYPGPKTAPATVTAKVLTARLFRGDGEQAAGEIEKFRSDHPDATGVLAGVNGKYADTLAKLLKAPPQVPPAGGGWTTFAGNPSRDGRPESPLPRYGWPSGRPTWATRIPRHRADPDKPNPASFPAEKTLAFHPVVADGFAYIADAGRVFRFDLKTGAARLAFHFESLDTPPNFREKDLPSFGVPCQADADFTLTSANGRLYARVGPTALPDGGEADVKLRTYLVALGPKPVRDPPPGELTLVAKWQIAPPVPADTPAAWEGAPVVADGRVYAAFVRVEANRLVHAVACYADPPAKPLWVADVCDADANRAAGGKNRHEVLTLAGGTVIFASHTGVTVALTAATGKPAWAFRNPPAARPPNTSPRDLCPPLAAAGRVFVAPADGDAVYALDADTGRQLWASPNNLQAEHLLGVSRGRLVVTLRTPDGPYRMKHGVRGFDVATGSTEEPFGWMQHDDPYLATYGRGLVDDNVILWPTARGLLLLDPTGGWQARPPVFAPHGNLAYADGVVLVATPTELWGYVFDPADRRVVPPPPRPFVVVGKPPAFDPTPVLPKVSSQPAAVTAPSLAAPAGVVRQAKLPAGAWPLHPLNADPTDTRFALCDGQSLHAGDAATGRLTWSLQLEPPAEFTHAAFLADGKLIAVGPHAVTAVSPVGVKKWDYRVPEADPRPEVSSPVFAGNRLVLRLGEHALVALDTGTGKPAWVRDAAGRTRSVGMIDGAPKFGRHLAAGPTGLIVYRDGERWLLNPADGTIRDKPLPSSLVEWGGPPATLPETDRAVVIPTGAASVEAVGLAGDFTRWRFDAGRPVSAVGAPRVRTFGDDCLVAVTRNHGTDVHQLNAADGAERWPRPAFLPTGELDLTAADADRDHLYVPTADRLFAMNRETGREAWAAALPPLPDGIGWVVRAGKRAVIAHATAAVPEETVSEVARRVSRRFAEFPNPLRLSGGLTLIETVAFRSLPILLFDPESGRQEQRLDVPAVGPTARVVLAGTTAAVLTAGRAVWLKAE